MRVNHRLAQARGICLKLQGSDYMRILCALRAEHWPWACHLRPKATVSSTVYHTCISQRMSNFHTFEVRVQLTKYESTNWTRLHHRLVSQQIQVELTLWYTEQQDGVPLDASIRCRHIALWATPPPQTHCTSSYTG